MGSCDDGSLEKESSGGNVRQRSSPLETEGTQIRNDEETREYTNIAREIVEHQLGHQVYQAVLFIAKTILFLLVFMLLCFLLGYDWIPKILAVFMMIATGVRYYWLWWNGKKETVIRFPVGST